MKTSKTVVLTLLFLLMASVIMAQSSGWARFPLGKLVPEPDDWPFRPTRNTEESFQIVIGWEKEEAIAYAEKCRAAGFNIGIDTENKPNSFYYIARNQDNIEVAINYGTTNDIKVSIYEEYEEEDY